jgi:hypothetical protein
MDAAACLIVAAAAATATYYCRSLTIVGCFCLLRRSAASVAFFRQKEMARMRVTATYIKVWESQTNSVKQFMRMPVIHETNVEGVVSSTWQ